MKGAIRLRYTAYIASKHSKTKSITCTYPALIAHQAPSVVTDTHTHHRQGLLLSPFHRGGN